MHTSCYEQYCSDITTALVDIWTMRGCLREEALEIPYLTVSAVNNGRQAQDCAVCIHYYRINQRILNYWQKALKLEVTLVKLQNRK